jgi:DNA-binding response OmpR family regulator
MPSAHIIEDELPEAGFLRLYLTEAGFDDFVICRRLDDALATLTTRVFDLILLDLTLADSAPEKTLRSLPEFAARCHTAGIIICSGYRSETLGSALTYAHAILQKPFNREAVVDVASTVVVSLASRRDGFIQPLKKKEPCPTSTPPN